MLIRAPLCKAPEIFKDFARVGMKNVRPVFMNEKPRVIVMVVSVAPDMRALITDQNLLV
jgi:hypothetical protein